MSRSERVGRDLALLKVAKDYVDRLVRQARAEADAMIAEANASLGSKNMEVRLSGEKVGTLSVVFSEPRVYVFYEREYQDWLRGWFVAGDDRVQPFYEAPRVEKGARVRVGDDGSYLVCDGETGELIPGMAYAPGGRVAGTRLSWAKGEGGKPKVYGVLERERLSVGDAVRMLGEPLEPDEVEPPEGEAL